MNDMPRQQQAVSAAEPRPIIPALAPFYAWTRELSYPFIRLVLGGLLIFHGVISGKLTGDTSVTSFAAGLVFGLHGQIERVTSKVFLLSPAHVEVSAEEGTPAPTTRGLFNQS